MHCFSEGAREEEVREPVPALGVCRPKMGLRKTLTLSCLFKFKTTSRQTEGFWWSMGQALGPELWGDMEWSQSLLPVVWGTPKRGGSMRGETEPWQGGD